jgi:hypothetical protein
VSADERFDPEHVVAALNDADVRYVIVAASRSVRTASCAPRGTA